MKYIYFDKQSFEISGQQFLFPSELISIADQLTEATEILNYQDDWDENGADATDQKTFLSAARFLEVYSNFIFKNYAKVLAIPYVDITRDGSISIDWETENGKFLIIFNKQPTNRDFYYGERLSNSISIKSAIEINSEIEVDESLAIWMKLYLA